MKLRFKKAVASALGVFTPNAVYVIDDEKLAAAWIAAGIAEPVDNKADTTPKEVKANGAGSKRNNSGNKTISKSGKQSGGLAPRGPKTDGA